MAVSTILRPRPHMPTVGRNDVGAEEGQEKFGATVVNGIRETSLHQSAIEHAALI